MSETNKYEGHTPGPWYFTSGAFNCDDQSNAICAGSVHSGMNSEDPNGRFVARIEEPGKGKSLANAALIADAPELLRQRDALLAICERFCQRVEAGEVRSKTTYAEMKAAIAATKGGV